MTKKRKLTLLVAIVIFLSGCSEEDFFSLLETNQSGGAQSTSAPEVTEGDAVVSFLDVGQGDSTLIQSEDTTILIDTGRHDGDVIFDHLEERGVSKLDLLVFTHPHADHIGNGYEIVRQYEPKEVWIDGNEASSQVFERLVDALIETNTEVYEPTRGDAIEVNSFLLEVLHPDELTGDLNNDSIGIRLTYGDVQFLFTGDAEESAEQAMVDSGVNLEADILKMGHHGSNTSTTLPFLEAVNPELAIYSAGENNSYNHPGAEAISRVDQFGAELLGTIEHGTIIVTTDGATFDVQTDK
ncbi:late competence protein ComEC, DNA transport [Bacillus sp. JCM 19046]|nr:late competence protein ComEC, DNA transport [Bacillus sp. JCM 19045]GAF18823.1 late competence protein ComEC, DNA transport [Bacillus sp. JCM 19046]